jgi:hypothetical protein
MHPRSFDALILLRGLVRSFSIARGVPPQSSKSVTESGWRLGRGERLAKFVRCHINSRHLAMKRFGYK